MNAKAEALKTRTHEFLVKVIKLCEGLPQSQAARSIAGQLLDSAGGMDSNYRAACRARSTREFIAKIGVAAEEADESLGWLQALIGAQIGEKQRVNDLIQEAEQLLRIFTASGKTAKQNAAAKKTPRNS